MARSSWTALIVAIVLTLPRFRTLANAVSQPQLSPAVHWDHDTEDLENLAPKNSHDLYYSLNGVSDPATWHKFAQLSSNLTYPAVVLEHSSHVKAVTCQGHDLSVDFTDTTALKYAKKAWASAPNFVLVTATDGCGTSSDKRTFWLIDRLEYRGCANCITAVVKQELTVREVLGSVDMVWGTYTPPAHLSKSKKPKRSEKRFDRTKRTPQRSSNNNGCGPAPSSNIDGFPTATCNSTTFDQDLDSEIGYLSFTAADYSTSLKTFAPGLNDYSPAGNPEFVVESRRLRRRGNIERRDFFDSFVDDIDNGFQDAGDVITDVADTVATGVTEAAGAVAAVPSLITNLVSGLLSKSYDLGIRVDLSPPDSDDSPFGSATQLYPNKLESRDESEAEGSGVTKDLKIYCVKCGVNGDINLNGRIQFDTNLGLQAANVGIGGTLAAGLGLGIDAGAELKKSATTTLASFSPDGFSIPDLVNIGPYIKLDAEFDLDISLVGQVLAGVNLNFPKISANLDLVNGGNSQASGFTPVVTPIFDAKAKIAASAVLALPLSIGIAFEITPIDYNKSVSLTETPSIQAALNYTFSTTCQGIDDDNACVNGVNFELDFNNDISADFFGIDDYVLDDRTIPLFSKCFPVGPQQNCPASAGSNPIATLASLQSSVASQATGKIAPSGGLTASNSSGGPFPYVTPALPSALPSGSFSQVAAPPLASNAATEQVPSADNSAFQNISSEAFANLPSNGSSSGTTPGNTGNTTSGTGMTSAPGKPLTSTTVGLPTLNGQYSLAYNPTDGNLNIGTSGSSNGQFAIKSGIVVGDSIGRFLHYYPDVMAKYNVSRLRLSSETQIPTTSQFIALAAVNYNDNNQTSNVYAAVDTLCNFFFLVTCNIQNQASKVFVVGDLKAGMQKLMDPQLRYTVTGGIVEQCYFLPFAAPPSQNAVQPGPAAAAANGTIAIGSAGSSPSAISNSSTPASAPGNGTRLVR